MIFYPVVLDTKTNDSLLVCFVIFSNHSSVTFLKTLQQFVCYIFFQKKRFWKKKNTFLVLKAKNLVAQNFFLHHCKTVRINLQSKYFSAKGFQH